MGDHISTDRPSTGTDEYELVSVVIEYDEQPNQCTIYPQDSNGIARMSRWISADLDCFVDRYSMR